MPAINVARTDTFEAQRQKINQIGTQIFSISEGGSDLSTGLLKLGDGLRTSPSLAFIDDVSLGIYRPSVSTLGFVAQNQKILDIGTIEGLVAYKDTTSRKNILIDAGITISNTGSNYDNGTYTEVPLLGGTGEGGSVNITVVGFAGTVTNTGIGYTSGQYSGIPLSGGTGSGAEATFFAEDFIGTITDVGTGYPPGAYVVDITGGTGTGAKASVSITGGATLVGSITDAGSGLTDGVYGQVQLFNDPLQTFVLTSVANPGATPPLSVYQLDGVTQPQLSLLKGNTYRFDVSDPSATGHPLYFQDLSGNVVDTNYFTVTSVGQEGAAGAFVELIIAPNAPESSIVYNCIAHTGMGAQINLYAPGTLGAPAGSTGQYGKNATADITVSGGVVTDVTIVNSGQGYAEADVLDIAYLLIGLTGANAEFTLGVPTYTGTVNSLVIQEPGTGYVQGDVISFSNSETAGYGSGFQFTVSSNPGAIGQFEITNYGTGYVPTDVLTFPVGVSNVSTTLSGEVTGVSTTLSVASLSATVASTAGIVAGMNVFTEPGSIGQLDQGVVVDAVPNSTTVTFNLPPILDGTASLSFTPSNTLDIVVPNASLISPGDTVEKVSGTGVLADNTTVSSVDIVNNVVSLSTSPETPGSVVLDFSPSFGTSSSPFSYRVDSLGAISIVNINNEGNGYFSGDTFSVNPSELTQNIAKTVTVDPIQSITFTTSISSSTLSVGDTIGKPDGEIVVFQTSSSSVAAAANGTYNGLSPSGGTGSGSVFDVFRLADGSSSANLDNGGSGYVLGDTLTIAGNLIGGSSPADDMTITVDSATTFPDLVVKAIDTAGGNITEVLVQLDDTDPLADADTVRFSGTGSTEYTINTASSEKAKYLIDGVLIPNVTLYEGSNYLFNTQDGSNANHTFGLSIFPGGQYAPSRIENVGASLETSSKQLTIASTVGILAGMSVTAAGVGVLPGDTFVETVDSGTQVTLSKFPAGAGSSTLTFAGAEYTDGVTAVVEGLQLKVTENTPSTLYYYCKGLGSNHEGMGSLFGTSGIITIDPNNPKTFGSGFVLEAFEVSSTDVIKSDVVSGKFTAVEIEAPTIISEFSNVSNKLTAAVADIGTLDNVTIINNNGLTTAVNLNGGGYSYNTGFLRLQDSTLTTQLLLSDNGNIDSPNGTITADTFSTSLSALEIATNVIESSSDIVLKPSFSDTVYIDNTVGLRLPVGDTNQRPTLTGSDFGYVRFNTDTDQYEGFSATTASWSSLGGVRDLDGNTTILAEESVGANDNTLWFINDGINTLKFTPEYQEFVNVKKVRSVNTTAPSSVEWTANSPVTAGQYLKYRNSIFVVVTGGTTATSGAEPSDLSGNDFTNGSSTLAYHTSAVSTLTFEEISELRIDPLGFTNLLVNNQLRFSNNVISTESDDLNVRPFAGQKIKIDAVTSLVVPVGDNNQKGNPEQGSIRYNTDDSQFEGYNGNQWGGLGGVKDVDQDTKIEAETSPGSDEDILYFFNNGNNTLRLTETQLEFDTIDTIASSSTDLNINASLVTFNNLDLQFNNSSVDSSLILSQKNNLDLGLSSGLYADHLLRLTNTGDIFYNLGFGTGTPNNVKLFDQELKTIEMKHFKMDSAKFTLERGTLNSGNASIYATSSELSSKVEVTALNVTTSDREIAEYFVTHKGSDVFFTDTNNVKTGVDLFSTVFDIDSNGNVRITVTLDDGLTTGDNVEMIIVNTITKR